MTIPATYPSARPANRRFAAAGVALAIAGLFGHLFAAHAIAWNPRAYPDHIAGFFVILAVTGTIIALLGRRFWRGRRDFTILLIGLVQAIFGFVIYLMRFHLA